MKLTSRSEYALLALVYLARSEQNTYQSVETVAHAQGIPAKFLEQILLALKRARYLKSSMGQRGGYLLASLETLKIFCHNSGAFLPRPSSNQVA